MNKGFLIRHFNQSQWIKINSASRSHACIILLHGFYISYWDLWRFLGICFTFLTDVKISWVSVGYFSTLGAKEFSWDLAGIQVHFPLTLHRYVLIYFSNVFWLSSFCDIEFLFLLNCGIVNSDCDDMFFVPLESQESFGIIKIKH